MVWMAYILYSLLACDTTSTPLSARQDLLWQRERQAMVGQQLAARGITDERILAAMGRVPRHRFVPESSSSLAYADRPVPIGYGQTVSQPFIVAYMIQALGVRPEDRVLEIGTGSGYQTAILAELTADVLTMEIVAPLAERAAQLLGDMGYRNVKMKVADGSQGWPEEAPFQAIIVSAAPEAPPQALLRQLAVGGRLIIPLGKEEQRLVLYRRTHDGYETTDLGAVVFVPLVDGE